MRALARLARMALILAGLWVGWLWLTTPASSQDYDQRWIERSLRKAEREERRCCAERRPVPRREHQARREPPRVHHYRAPRPAPVAHHEPPPGPRVYGVELRTPQRVERDVLSNIECMPPIRELSHEYLTEEAAWKGAQLAWENKTRWLYGERFMNIHHALNMIRRCNKSTAAQSAGGRAVEIVAGAIGQDGHKNRCEIIASPCMAPEEINPDRKR